MPSWPEGPLHPAQLKRFVTTGGLCLRDAVDFSSGSLMSRWRDRLLADRPTTPGHYSPPPTVRAQASAISPAVSAAASQLLGGARETRTWWWYDAAVVNLGPDPSPEREPSWHVDGDFFVHFLDSPEQGLLTLVLWTDVTEDDGPTRVWLDSISPVAEALRQHPEGLEQTEVPARRVAAACSRAFDLTGRAGDVFLLHPMVVHASLPSRVEMPRILSNPVIQRVRPFPLQLDVEPRCAVAECTLNALGRSAVDYRPTGSRAYRRPPRLTAWEGP